MVDLNKGGLQATNPKCPECGMIHPRNSSGKCPIKHREVAQETESPIEVKEFLSRLESYLKGSERSITIMDGIVKLLNL